MTKYTYINFTRGNGRGTRKLCSEPIKKGERQLIMIIGTESGRVHDKCLSEVRLKAITTGN